MSNDNSGPAFPVPLNPGQPWQGMAPCDGMTLRDYFAAKALQAVQMPQSHMHDHESVYDRIASHCWKMADAMLKAREAV